MECTLQLYTAYNRMRERIIFSVVPGQVCLTTPFLRPPEIVVTVVHPSPRLALRTAAQRARYERLYSTMEPFLTKVCLVENPLISYNPNKGMKTRNRDHCQQIENR